MGGNWKIALQENIRSSEEKLERLRGRQASLKNAQKMLTTTPGTYSEEGHGAFPRKFASLTESGDGFQHLESRVNNCVAEIEIERTARCGDIQNLKHHVSNQMGELRAMFLQLKNENDHLTETVRSLEKRTMATSAFATAARVDAVADGRGNENYSPVSASVAISGLSRRVEELESTVTRQRRVIEDRQTRLDSLLREMVSVKVATEIERVRTIARDAARESTEDLVRLRLSAVQSMFNTELQKTMESTGASGEVARTTERMFRKMEEDVMRRLHEVSSIVDAFTRNQKQGDSALSEMERCIMQRITEMESGIIAMRREMKDGLATNMQACEASFTAAKLELEATVTERILVASKTVVSKDDIAAAVADSHEQLQRQCCSLREGLAAVQQTHEASSQRCSKRLAHLEEIFSGLQDTSAKWERKLEHTEKLVSSTRDEVEQLKPRIREALSTGEEARAFAQESLACAHKEESTTREGLARSSVQLQTLVREQEMSASTLRQLGDKIESTDISLAAVKVVIDELSERHQNTFLPLNAKLEMLQRVVHDRWTPQIEGLNQSVGELQALSEQMQADASSRTKSDSRQLLDLRRDVSKSVQEVEDRLTQVLYDWQQEGTKTTNGLKSSVDTLNAIVRTHEHLFGHKEVLDMSLRDLENISEKLRTVEKKLDAVPHRAVKEELTPTSMPVSGVVDAVALRVEVGRQLEELSRRVDGVEHNIETRLAELQWQRQQQREQVEYFNQHLQRIREDNSSHVQNLRTLLEEHVEERCRCVLVDVQSSVQRQQVQLDRLRETSGAKRLVSAICDDEELQHELADALHKAFAPRSDTSESLTRIKKRIQQVDVRLGELDLLCAAQKCELERQSGVCDALQRSHPEHVSVLEKRLRQEVVQLCSRCELVEERIASVETEQQQQKTTTADFWGRLHDETRKESRQNAEQLVAYMDERVEALQSITTEAGQQARSLQLALQELQEEQALLKRDVAKFHAGCELNEAENNSKSKKPDDEDAWMACVEKRIDAVETKTEAAVQSTADALGGLHEGMEQCVALFVQEVTSSLSSTLFQYSDADWPGLEAIAAVSGLDSVLVFIWQHICALYATMQTLQDGALGTLDLLQHHEEHLAMLAALRSLTVRNTHHVGELATMLGLPLDLHIDPFLTAGSEERDGSTKAATPAASPTPS